jgi:hypothetical protein
MEPKLPAPNLGPEQSPMGYGQNVERAPQLPTPEIGAERGHERFEQRGEVSLAPAMPVLPAPVIVPEPQVVSDDTAAATVSDDMPLVANDDDLIEKEWVVKAKKIIVQTKDDPYRREQEVGKLQADYLHKRYGRELGASQ